MCMNAEPQPSSIFFNGIFEHGLDEKRRIQIPAKWRPANQSGYEFTVIVWPKYKEGVCLRVLPPDQMVKLLASIDKLEDSDPAKPTLKRLIGSKSIQAELDKAGRVCIPDSMAQAAGITKDAVLAGMVDKFEIWSPERLAKRAATDEAVAPEMLNKLE